MINHECLITLIYEGEQEALHCRLITQTVTSKMEHMRARAHTQTNFDLNKVTLPADHLKS